MKWYRVYKILLDNEGNVVNRTPICRVKTLNMAYSMARTNAGIGDVGIYEINSDGSETRVI